MQYTVNYFLKKKKMKISLDKFDFVVAVITSTHKLGFGSNMRKLGIPLKTLGPFFYIKAGFKGVNMSWTYYPV